MLAAYLETAGFACPVGSAEHHTVAESSAKAAAARAAPGRFGVPVDRADERYPACPIGRTTRIALRIGALFVALSFAACGVSRHDEAKSAWSNRPAACAKLKAALTPPLSSEKPSLSEAERAIAADISKLAALQVGAPKAIERPLSDLIAVYRAVDQSLKTGSAVGMSDANKQRGWSDVQELESYMATHHCGYG